MPTNTDSPSINVEIRSPDFELTPAIRQYAMDHLAAKLVKHARRIQTVIVRFEDPKSARHGVDKVCRVEVLIPHHEPVIVEEVDDDLRAAIDLAADRVAVVVGRELDRMRDEPRHRGGKAVREGKTLA